MIELHFPKASEDRYLFFQGLCLGPFDSNCLYKGEMVEFNSTLRSLEQKSGMYGENTVEHQKLSGRFEYHPMINGCSPAPLNWAPFRVAVPCWDYVTKEVTVYANAGLGMPDSVNMSYTSSSMPSIWQYACIRDPITGNWTIWQTLSAVGYARCSSTMRWDITSFHPLYGDTVGLTCRYRSWNSSFAGYSLSKYDWCVQQSADVIISTIGTANPVSDSIRVDYYTAKVYKVRIPSYTNSTADMKRQIDSLIGTIFQGKEFPVKDYPYGDLAMRALNQVDSNHTNMIEFLRDLRHPAKMIPKLRNLRSLKGLSSTYLGVKYGILPTVNDLQTIVKAFKARAPYLDKNGFRTYSAGETTALTIDNIVYTKIQYLKVALENEDDEFKLLIERLENMGIFPDFEKIWDIVPYSFVIDWFVDVGKMLKRVDTNLRILRLNIRYVTMSRKTTVRGVSTAESLQTPFIGSIDWTKYHRWVSDQCPGPTLSLTTPSQPFNHWLDAGALIIQRK